jgi:adenosylcobinamide-GDP ribazoletransferase
MSEPASAPIPSSNVARHTLLAMSFLTRVPVRRLNAVTSDFAKAPLYFPMIGTGIGVAGAGFFSLAHTWFSVDVSIGLTLGLLMLLTGALHEDGLADSFDAFGSRTKKEDILEVMRDSRIGTYGSLALVMIVLLKFVSLSDMSTATVMVALIVGHTLSRWTTLPGLVFLPYPRNSTALSKRIVEQVAGVSRWYLLLSTGYTLVIAFVFLRLNGLAVFAVVALVCATGLAYFKRKIQGATGDCYGALQQCSELAIYLTILVLA